MNRTSIPGPRWSTSSFGHAPEMSPTELVALGQHLDLCSAAGGRWVALRCVAEAVLVFLAARVVTTLVVVTVVMGAGLQAF